MHTGSRVLIGLLLLSLAGFALAEETAAPPPESPPPAPEVNREAPAGNAEPTPDSAALATRATDVAPTSWSNVKALWG
ncbi:hypothetical protein FJ251_00440 [bacterium]|nr:hypothetical protein [bacterium]